ncbi:surface lipoprotein assembly modifier [Parasphingorhabdus sp. JC815]|uniref:surface lipoprotein assembly modifier n=1 Tax=Parasphingorhabdus sp. JC815 TaxID=3232140 RepID=UPI00345750FE
MTMPVKTIKALFICGGLAMSLYITPVSAEDRADAETTISAAVPKCDDTGTCHFQITPAQLLAQAEAYVHAKQYDRALPLIDALSQVPAMRMQQQFLSGYIAVETGDLKGAISNFRTILDDNPGQTRVRLELARTYLMSGKEASADYHFRLAQNDDNLPDEIARTIRNTRSILRDQRVWRFSFDFGFAPDTNINGATNAETVDVNFGAIFPLLGDAQGQLELDENARQKSGIGQIAGFSGGVRLKASNKLAFLFDADSKLINYQGQAADDIVAQIAAGPEVRIARYASVSLQAVGLQRWYGGSLATREYGARIGFQAALSQGQRIGIELDGRRTDSKLNDSFSGWQLGANATYEHLIGKSLIASASLFTRRDLLNSDGYSSINYGVNLGIGGELPLGLNAGVSGSISRSTFDEALLLYSTAKRKDWRSFARAYIGSRQIKLLGFSPSVDYNYSRVDSNYGLYKMDRHRVNFKLAKFF